MLWAMATKTVSGREFHLNNVGIIIKKKKDEDALKINSSVYVLRADTCKHCIFFFFFFVQFDKYMNYKALSMYKPECHS